MPTPEQVRAAVDAYCAAYAGNDKQAFLDAFTDDGVVIDPVGTPEHVGREARAEFWDGVHGLAESISFDVQHVHVCADQAAMVFTINAAIRRWRDGDRRGRRLPGRRRRHGSPA